MYFVYCAVVSTTAQWTIYYCTVDDYYCTVDSCIPMDCLPGSDRWSQPTALLGYPAALKYSNLPYSITLSPRHHNLTHVSHPPPSVKLGNFQSIP